MQDQDALDGKWRIVIPDDPKIKGKIMEEIHAVPYFSHLGYQKTLKGYKEIFTNQISQLP